MALIEPRAARAAYLDPDKRLMLIKMMTGMDAQNPDRDDTVTLCVCGGMLGLTGIMVVYAWCNYSYRPIRAKNLTWTTLIYIATVLWFIGDIGTNQHVRMVGVWANCKLWVIWFRILFCFVFASMTVVRLYALDRVFNQKKPFTTRSSIVAGAIVVFFNGTFCLINQLLAPAKSAEYVPAIEACNITMTLRIVALAYQWVQWTACGFLIFRLRNIQSSFNEFYQSIAIFAVIIGLLLETTIINLKYQFYVFSKARRIEKTVVDAVAGVLVVWLFIGYPVLMSIFNRREYEQKWLEMLARDAPNNTFNVSSNPNGTTAYAKMNDPADSAFQTSQLHFDNDPHSGYISGNHRPFDDPDPLNIESTLNAHVPYNDNLLPMALRNNMHIHRPVLNTPSMFPHGYSEPSPDGRHVL
ncbi:hypothetical protein H4R18_004268 [Coemansia javaensis]|uniref:Uncharacterized protein n=1 Tax=Coemansia javaensis TaxID=2761396 RepID=A0A9W8LF35_9FUNG|nr:hypothetical protein H4R18_004268 [Coemansia javaensis]